VLRFTPGSIDVFTTWQGTWLYAGLCLALLYGINLQQQQLASAGLLALHPVPPPPPSSPKPNATETKVQLERVYPNLRPLDLAAKGQALSLLSRTLLKVRKYPLVPLIMLLRIIIITYYPSIFVIYRRKRESKEKVKTKRCLWQQLFPTRS
jgi:hypothetical protein